MKFYAQNTVKPTFWQVFSSQPHRLFFAGGIFYAIFFMTVFLLEWSGIFSAAVPLASYHFYTMAFMIFSRFFIGFLFTTFPRFLAVSPIEKKIYIKIFYLYEAGSLLFALSLFISPLWLSVAVFVNLIAHAMAFALLFLIYRLSPVSDKQDPFYMLAAFGFGVAAHLLFFLQQTAALFGLDAALWLHKGSFLIGFFLYLVLMAFVITQRMVPFFTTAVVFGYEPKKSTKMLLAATALLSLKVVFMFWHLLPPMFVVDVVLLILSIRELHNWRLPFTKAPAILWVLYLSLLWIPVGFAVAAIEDMTMLLQHSTINLLERSSLHIFALGYLTTILVGFGSRVILGHSGRTPTADRFTVYLFLFIQAIVVLRLMAGVAFFAQSSLYPLLIGISATGWIMLFGLWSYRYLKILLF